VKNDGISYRLFGGVLHKAKIYFYGGINIQMLRVIIAILKWMGKCGLLLFFILCCIFILIQTDYGKDKVIDLANLFLNEKYGIKVETTGLRGIVPYNINIDSLSIHDQSGKWLDIQNFTFRFSIFNLFKGRIFIRELRADSIILDRIPAIKKQDSLKSRRPFSWMTIIYNLQLERLNIKRLSLGKDILGKPSSFMIEARITEKEPEVKSLVSMNVKRTDGAMGSAFVHAEIKGSEPYLKIDAAIEEPEEGLLGAILGIKTPLFMTMKGSGPIKDWSGKLFIRADSLTEIDAKIRLNFIKGLNLDLDGTSLFYPGIIPKYLSDFLEPETRFKITARIKGRNNLLLDLASIESKNISCILKGNMDIKHMISEGSLAISMKDISPLEGLIHNKCSGRLSADINFKGPISLPTANMTLTIRDLSTATIKSDEFRANAFIEFFSSDGSSPPALHVSGKGDILKLSIKSLPESLLEKQITWALDMTGYNNGDLKVKNLHLDTGVLSADISGIFNKDNKAGSFVTILEAKSLERYSSFLKDNIPSGIRLSAKLNTTISGHSLSTHISGNLGLSKNADAFLTDIIGPEVAYIGDIELSNLRVFKFYNVKINSDKAKLVCSGLYDLYKQEIHTVLSLESDNLAAFSSFLKRDIQGSLRIDSSMDGIIDRLNLKAEATAENLLVNKIRFNNVSASVALTGKPLTNEGQISLVIEQPGYIIKGDSGFKLDNESLEFKNILFKGPGFNLNGNIFADNKNALAEGEVRAECEDLSSLASLFGKKIQGKATLNIKLNPIKGKNLIDLNITANDISGSLGKSDNININLRASGDLNDPEISASASLLGFSNKNIFIKSMNISAMGKFQDMRFSATGRGYAGYDIHIKSSGTLSLSSLKQSLVVNSFQGEYGIIPIDLARPLKVIYSKDAIELESMELTLASGTIDGSGNFSNDYLNFKMNFNNIPASLLQLAGIAELEGMATGNIILSGISSQPQATIQIIMNNLRLRDPQYVNLPPFMLSAHAYFQYERLKAGLSINSSTGIPFKLDMDFPLRFSLSPFLFSYPENGELIGHLSGEIDLENISSLIGLYDQLLKGRLTVSFDIKGTIKSPTVTGEIKLENCSYENKNTGTFIKDINANISADGSRFILNRITGTDGMGGNISGQGWLDFSPSRRFPYSLSLDVKNMTFVMNNASNLTLSGKPSLSGTINDHTLKGNFTVEKGELRIPDRLPVEITDLEVREINSIKGNQALEQKRHATKSTIKLDLSIEGARQVYMTGRGLNSEWRGNLLFKGTSAEPIITGRLSILRGSYNFLGKTFTLTNGVINLDGKYPISPYLEVTGEAETSETTAIINITGNILKPEITLTSEPPMPSDEILSQLLFGRKVAQITPLQAIELSNAINSMLGRKSYDIIGSTRKILGVDQLEVKQSKGNIDESTVSIGKYVRNDLYIEVEKGLGAESGKASVTWEITPNITVDTEIGEKSSTGIGVNWKWDY
jgi:translocation and assembly module TamB